MPDAGPTKVHFSTKISRASSRWRIQEVQESVAPSAALEQGINWDAMIYHLGSAR